MIRRLAPLLILAALLGFGFLLLGNPPGLERGGPPEGPQTVVETLTVEPQDYLIRISSFGTVQPRTRSTLVAQVRGQIVPSSPVSVPAAFLRRATPW